MADIKKLLLLRFGELWLKSFEVRRRFTDRLLTNISDAFNAEKIPFKSIKSHDRIFLEVSKNDLAKATEILSRTFGLVSFSIVEEIETDKEKIRDFVIREASKVLKPKDTFAIRARRTGTHEFTSRDLERELGSAVVGKFGNKVDLVTPDKTIFVEIRDNKAYIFSEKTGALGGLPLGVEGKVAVLFSEYYEKSTVASFLMMKRGCKTVPLFVGRKSKKANEAIQNLSKYDPLLKPVFIKSEKNAFEAARESKARALVTAESLADILSEKKKAFDKKTGIFVLQPLVGFDEKKLKEMCENIVR
ncbi:tRNA sulfurtransferase [uncultured archaeon]|nr:tRNA sulfurtransferase [uncultured archaeon]